MHPSVANAVIVSIEYILYFSGNDFVTVEVAALRDRSDLNNSHPPVYDTTGARYLNAHHPSPVFT